MNPPTVLPPFINLSSKGHIKYVTGSVRVMVSINIKLLVLHFIYLYSVDGAPVGQQCDDAFPKVYTLLGRPLIISPLSRRLCDSAVD